MPTTTNAPSDSPEHHPEIIARSNELDLVTSRLEELKIELHGVNVQLETVKSDGSTQPNPAADLDRLLNRQRDPIGDEKRQQLQRRRGELRRDIDTLALFEKKAQHTLHYGHHRVTEERVRQDDVVASVRAIAAIAAQLEAANKRAQQLLGELAAKGYQNLGSSQFAGLQFPMRSVSAWVAEAEVLCGATLKP